jgi:beta-galactosidase
MNMTRRQFVARGASTAFVMAGATRPISASIARAVANSAGDGSDAAVTKLDEGWELFQGSLDGPWEVWHSEELANFAPVGMPHCFNAYDACDPDTPYYRGPGWYRTKLMVSNPFAGGRTLLHFQGAGQTTAVFIGETKVGEHIGGYDEFVLDITEAVVAQAIPIKGIPLAVLCDNSRDLERIPSDFSDFSLYGGLYRHVHLVYVPGVSLEAVAIIVHGAEAQQPKATINIRLYAPQTTESTCTISVSIVDPVSTLLEESTHRVKVISGNLEIATIALPNPLRWSPENPQLYQCRVKLDHGADTTVMQERFGVRHYEFVEHGPFRLNGERLLLRGTHRHEDHAGYAAAMPDDLIREEMRLIKAMGANFIRLAHYQQSRLVLELCDELGLLVWEEVPWCRAGVGDEAWKQMGRSMLTAMIDQHRNHPSIILWGLGNEDDWPTEYPAIDEAAIRSFMTELHDLARRIDPTRLTSSRRCDFARDIPDVYSSSIWAGWYSGRYTEYEGELKKQQARVKRFVHIEWGADSHAGRHSETPERVIEEITTGHGVDEHGMAYLSTGGRARVSKDGDWSESYACDLFDWHLQVQEKLPWLTGAAQWIFKDFTTPLRVENPIPRINQKGVVARDLTPKESYFVFQSYWSEKPMVHIYGHTWPVRWGKVGEPKIVKVYSNCDEVELFHAGQSLGVRKRDSRDFPAAGLRWAFPFSVGENQLRAVGKRGPDTVSDEIQFLYESRIWGPPANFLITVRECDSTHTDVEAKLVDTHGVTCLDARIFVRFSLAGNGRLLDNLGTVGGSRFVQMTNGRAGIRVKPGGECIVSIAADTVPAAFITLRPQGI